MSGGGGGDAARINWPLYREYRNELGKLTFSSKPIINDLSKKADANIADAETVLKAIEEHLRFTVPKMKLPTFYLLDSIAKNVGGMYVSLLHGRVARIFVDVWQSVDDGIRGNMERTLQTWRHGCEGGKRNLFPEFVLRKIDEDIARLKAKAKEVVNAVPETDSDDLLGSLSGMQSYARKRAREEQQQSLQRMVAAKTASHNGAANGRVPGPADPRQRGPGQAQDTANRDLLHMVSDILLKKKVELLRRPNDSTLFTVLETLKDIKASLAEAGLSPERASEIRRQLMELDGGGGAQPSNGARPAAPAAAPQPDPASKPADAGQLLQSIMARPDLISSLSKVAPGLSLSLGSGPAAQQQQQQNQNQNQNQNQGWSQPAPPSYADFSQLEPIQLDHASISRARPGIHNILYAGYGGLCSQCGWRTRGDAGDQMKQHLDWHFRRNRRQQSGAERRAMARGWYPDQALWEAGAAADDEAQPAAATPGAGAAGPDEDEKEKLMAELRKKTVPATADRGGPCAICKEAFERRFNEDAEDWELVNAVLVDGAVLHATCHADSG